MCSANQQVKVNFETISNLFIYQRYGISRVYPLFQIKPNSNLISHQMFQSAVIPDVQC